MAEEIAPNTVVGSQPGWMLRWTTAFSLRAASAAPASAAMASRPVTARPRLSAAARKAGRIVTNTWFWVASSVSSKSFA